MPRKSTKPRKSTMSPVTQDTARRAIPITKRGEPQKQALRQQRPSLRPPKFPGRLGGR